jgi:Bacterial Ig domain/Glucodextranase, domain B/Divergent InlB B-repeat domain
MYFKMLIPLAAVIVLAGCGTFDAPPKISMASSTASITAVGSLKLVAAASDDKGVTKVEFFQGTQKLGEDATAPYELEKAVGMVDNGSMEFTATAYDTKDQSSTSDKVSVEVQIADTIAPKVSVTTSAASFTASGNLTFTAEASDDVGVTKVEFYDGSTKVNEDTSSPFEFVMPVTPSMNGPHVLMAKAFDAAGHVASSSTVSVTVNIQDTESPKVSLAANSSSVTANGNLELTATASDNTGVAKVVFLEGSTILGEDTSSPYSLSLAMDSGKNGTHTYTAKAFDTSNNMTLSAGVPVTVNIRDTELPSLKITAPADNSNTSTNTVRVTGTASDNIGVTAVTYTFNGGTSQAATGTNTWEFTPALATGQNTITVFAKDAAGNQSSSVTHVTYTPANYLLTVTKSGAGSGSVSSAPAGIDCGSTCTQTLSAGTQVTLTATAVRYSVFKGWTGACTGTGTCVVTMNAAQTVNAQFELAPLPKVEVQLFNVDDTETAQVNSASIITTTLGKDSGRQDISQNFTKDVNRLDLSLNQAGGQYSYGFRVWLNGQLILEDICGVYGGASCNANDVGASTPYYNRIIIRRDGTYTAVNLDRKQIVTWLNKSNILNATSKGQTPSSLHWSGNIPGSGWIDLPGTGASYTHTPQVAGGSQICVGGLTTGETLDAAMCASVIVPKLEVRLFNVDDTETTYIGGVAVLRADIGQDTGRVDLTKYLTGDAQELVIENANGVGAYAFGFQVYWQGVLILDQSCGVVWGASCDPTTNGGIRYWKRIMLRGDGAITIVNLYTARHKVMHVGETYWIGAEVWGTNSPGGLIFSYGNPSGQWAQLPNNSLTPTTVGTYTVCAGIPSLAANPTECAILDVVPDAPPPNTSYDFMRSGWDAAKLDQVVAGNLNEGNLTQRLIDLGMSNLYAYLVPGQPHWQCAELANAMVNQSGREWVNTTRYRQGPRVADLNGVTGLQGVLIATFSGGQYNFDAGLGWGHVAIFKEWIPGGVRVWNANQDNYGTASFTDIMFGTSGSTQDLNRYHFVIW